jgi:sugar phosphate isomerase/epimerase
MKTNRRHFIQTAAASAAAAMALQSRAEAVSQANASAGMPLNRNPLKLGLMTYLVGQSWDIPTIIKNLKETKYEHVQLRTTHKHGVEPTLTKEQRAAVKQQFLDAGLKASTACTHQYHDADPAVLRRHIEGTKNFLQLTADIGAQGLRVFPNGVPDEGNPNREKVLEQIGKSVAECAVTARSLGVQLRMEEHGNGTSNIPTVKKILDYANNPDVYVIWNCSQTDTGRGPGLPKGFEGMPIAKQFEMVKGRIGNVHLRELYTDYPWRELFSLLSASNYQGYCDVEVSPESAEPIRFLHSYRALFLALQNAV